MAHSGLFEQAGDRSAIGGETTSPQMVKPVRIYDYTPLDRVSGLPVCN